MELEFDVKINSSDLYDYLLYHTYTGISGIFGTLAGALFLASFAVSRYPIHLIAGLVIIGYIPYSLFLRSKQQAHNNAAFKEPIHYRMTDEGISVSQGESSEAQGWDSCVKAVSTVRSVILYTSKTTASIFPKRDLEGKKDALIQMISTHMPPNKVKIRF